MRRFWIILLGTLCFATLVLADEPDPLTIYGRDAELWLKDLASENVAKRRRAGEALAAAGTRALPLLAKELKTNQTAIRHSILGVINEMPSQDVDMIHTMALALDAENWELRRHAVQLLSRWDGMDKQTTPELQAKRIAAMKHLSAHLVDPHPEVFTAAISGLGALGWAARVRGGDAKDLPALAYQGLSAGWRDVDESQLAARAMALHDLSVARSDYLPLDREVASAVAGTLTEMLDYAELSVWRAAALGLADGCPPIDVALERLTVLVLDEDEECRGLAALALGEIGERAAPALLTALEAGVPDLSDRLARGLAKMGSAAAPGVPTLIKLYRTGGPETSPNAAFVLRHVGSAVKPYFKDLWSQLRSPLMPIYPRETFEETVLSLPSEAAAIVNAGDGVEEFLVEMAGAGRDAGVKDYALRLLQIIKPKQQATAKMLVQCMNQPLDSKRAHGEHFHDLDPRRSAAHALAAMGESAMVVMPELMKMLEDTNTDHLWRVFQVINGIGPKADQAVPRIGELMIQMAAHEEKRNLLESAAETLAHLGDQGALKLLTLIDHKSEAIQSAVGYKLGECRGITPEILPTLLEIYDRNEKYVVQIIEKVIVHIGPVAIPEIERRLMSSDTHMRRRAAYTLRGIGEPALKLMLAQLPKGDDEQERGEASSIIHSILDAIPNDARTTRHIEYSTAIAEYLEHEKPDVRIHAANLLQASAMISEVAWTKLAVAKPDADQQERLVRMRACQKHAASRSMTERKEVFVPALSDPSKEVRRVAIESLGGLDLAQHPDILKLLVTRLLDDDESTASAAATALQRAPCHDDSIRPLYLEALKQTHPQVLSSASIPLINDPMRFRHEAADIREWILASLAKATRFYDGLDPTLLRKLDVAPETYLPQIVALLNKAVAAENTEQIRWLSSTLEQLITSIQQLEPLLDSEHQAVRDIVLRLIGNSWDDDAIKVSILSKLLSDDDEAVRLTACRVCNGFGVKAEPLRKQLEKLAKDPNVEIARSAQAALEQLR